MGQHIAGRTTSGGSTPEAPASGSTTKGAAGGSARGGVLRSAAQGAAKGATRGGLAGAAKGAVGGAVRSGGGKRVLAMALLGSPIIAIPLVIVLLAGVVLMVTGFSADQSDNSFSAAASSGIDAAAFDAYVSAADDQGVPWQVLAAVVYVQKNGGSVEIPACPATTPASTPVSPSAAATTPSATTTSPTTGTAPTSTPPPGDLPSACIPSPSSASSSVAPSGPGGGSAPGVGGNAYAVRRLGVRQGPATPTATPTAAPSGAASVSSPYEGPYKIDRRVLPQGAQPDSLEWSSEWVAGRLHTLLERDANAAQSTGWTEGMDFGAGEVLGTDTPPAIDPSDPTAKIVKAAYVRAVSELPLQGASPQFGGDVYQLAMAWYLGQAVPPGSLSGSGLVCDPGAGATLTAGGGGAAGGGAGGSGQSAVTLDAQQLAYAAEIVHTAQSEGLNTNAMVIAIMVALQESHLQMYANANVADSMGLPHGPVGSDHYSVGLFQQQPHPYGGWGSTAEAMDPVASTRMFLGTKDKPADATAGGLLDYPGWQSMPPGQAAQTVQVSATPDAYIQWQSAANQIVGKVLGIACSAAGPTSDNAIVAAAERWLGKAPYVWDAGSETGPTTANQGTGCDSAVPQSQGGCAAVGFDCSGLALYAYAQAGHHGLPHQSGAQYDLVQSGGGVSTATGALKPGMLVFFTGTDPGAGGLPGHVGIFVGTYSGPDGLGGTISGGDIYIQESTEGQMANMAHLASAADFVGGGFPWK